MLVVIVMSHPLGSPTKRYGSHGQALANSSRPLQNIQVYATFHAKLWMTRTLSPLQTTLPSTFGTPVTWILTMWSPSTMYRIPSCYAVFLDV